jgi:hypothetical protein
MVLAEGVLDLTEGWGITLFHLVLSRVVGLATLVSMRCLEDAAESQLSLGVQPVEVAAPAEGIEPRGATTLQVHCTNSDRSCRMGLSPMFLYFFTLV